MDLWRVKGGAKVTTTNPESPDEWWVDVPLTGKPDKRWYKLWHDLQEKAEGASNYVKLFEDEELLRFSARKDSIASQIRLIDTLLDRVNSAWFEEEQAVSKEREQRAVAREEKDREKAEIQRALDSL